MRPHAEQGACLAARLPCGTSNPWSRNRSSVRARFAQLVAYSADTSLYSPMPSPMEAFGVVPEFIEDVPDRKRVLAATHGHKHAISRLEHVELRNGLRGLVSAQLEKVLAAEIRIVTPDVERLPACDTRGTSRGTPTRDDRADLDDCVSVEHRAGGNERAVLDHEVALALRPSRARSLPTVIGPSNSSPKFAEQDLTGDAPFDFGVPWSATRGG